MRLSHLVASLPDQVTLSSDPEIAGLTADSREVSPGFLFAALSGTQADGADFIPDALTRGAAAILAAPGIAGSCAVPVIEAEQPRAALARLAARFHPGQPGCVAAVTGTNGKTSVASFVRQIWQMQGLASASLGTLGLEVAGKPDEDTLTTPDPVTLHKLLKRLHDHGVSHAVLEASSHGLAQHRVDGVDLCAAAFTNISRDHLDYHKDFDDYLTQKTRLFSECLPTGGVAVIHVGTAEGRAIADMCQARGLRVMTVGPKDATIALTAVRRQEHGQTLTVDFEGRGFDIILPLAGAFQADNALVAAGLVMACGADAELTFGHVGKLRGARGRLELVGHATTGAAIYVDYAHTPDALKTALLALRPHAAARLAVVFGCGGDRDRGKRPQMGAEARAHADVIYVTDDNPRSEDPAHIRAEILAACPAGIDIGDRAVAIEQAIDALGAGDLLLIAGKGHETGQIVGDEILPFSDRDVVLEVLGAER